MTNSSIEYNTGWYDGPYGYLSSNAEETEVPSPILKGFTERQKLWVVELNMDDSAHSGNAEYPFNMSVAQEGANRSVNIYFDEPQLIRLLEHVAVFAGGALQNLSETDRIALCARVQEALLTGKMESPTLPNCSNSQ